MTTAQPGQEQRMERDLDAEANTILARHVEYMGWPQSGQIMTRTHNALAAIKEALTTRPTADIGEDGELVERVAVWLDKQRVDCAPSTLVGVAISVDDLEGLIRIARAAPYKEALRQIHDHIAPRLGGDQYLIGEAIVKICRPLLASETIND